MTSVGQHLRIAGFDPFNDRSSRTVRNTLSEQLRDCLDDHNVFSEAATDLRQRYPQAPYADYIRDRVTRYRTATSEALSAGDSPVARAAILWRHGLYFEAHEILEPHWQAAAGREKEGLKGLIQAAGAYVHREAGQDKASVTLARKAVDRLRQYGDTIGDRWPMGIETLLTELALVVTPPAEPRETNQ